MNVPDLDGMTQHCCTCVGCTTKHWPQDGCVCGGAAVPAPAQPIGGTVGLDQGDGSTRRAPAHPPTLVDLAALDEAAPAGPYFNHDCGKRELLDGAAMQNVIVHGERYPHGFAVAYCDPPAMAEWVVAAKGFAPRLLAALRALPRYVVGELDYNYCEYESADGDWIKVGDLLTLLGDKQ